MNWTNLNSRAYVPYSNTPKSCVIEGNDGAFYAGVRIENVSFPLTISAIQSACVSCLSIGDSPTKLFLPHSQFEQLDFWVKEFNLEVILSDELPSSDFVEHYISGKPNELSRLKELLPLAITTHSDFPVSAILYSELGYFEGVNIEVSDWALGICAERVALSKAISSGKTTFQDFAVHTKLGDVSSPCGACRQVIIEHLPLNKIRMHHADNTLSEYFSVDLLPFSFRSKSLGK